MNIPTVNSQSTGIRQLCAEEELAFNYVTMQATRDRFHGNEQMYNYHDAIATRIFSNLFARCHGNVTDVNMFIRWSNQHLAQITR